MSSPHHRTEVLTGAAIAPALDHAAALASIVFNDFPYLFDGGVAAERAYMQRYAERPGAALVLGHAADAVVGAATCMPLAVENDYIQAPFLEAGWTLDRVCYLGESVLLRPHRGQGFGVAFFRAREAHASALGLDVCAFFAIERPADHPLRPEGYTPLDAFWRKRGYAPMPGMTATMRWRDRNEDAPSPKRLAVWARSLSGATLP
jgi:GNAT superfamily N-acetyltransferase